MKNTEVSVKHIQTYFQAVFTTEKLKFCVILWLAQAVQHLTLYGTNPVPTFALEHDLNAVLPVKFEILYIPKSFRSDTSFPPVSLKIAS